MSVLPDECITRANVPETGMMSHYMELLLA